MGGAVYHLPWYEALIRAQVAKGFAAPPPALIHDPIFGNQDLKPETDVNYQLGGEIHPVKALKLELNFFEADVNNFIDFNQATFKWDNIEKVKRQGIEARASATLPAGPWGNLGLSFGGTFVDVRNEETGDVIKDVPRQIMDISASHSIKRVHSVHHRQVYRQQFELPGNPGPAFRLRLSRQAKAPLSGHGSEPQRFFRRAQSHERPLPLP